MLIHSTVKRPGRPLVRTSTSGLQMCRLLHITDHTNRLTFLVDTGAEVSVLPPTRTDRLRKQEGFTLSAVNGSAITKYSTRSLTLNLGLRRTFRRIFIIADVHKPLLGADFLHHFGLLVDMTNSKLVNKHTCLSTHGMLMQDTLVSPTVSTHFISHDYSTLLSEFSELTKVHNYGDGPVKHDITHHISTSGPPVSCRARRLSPEKLGASLERNLSTCWS